MMVMVSCDLSGVPRWATLNRSAITHSLCLQSKLLIPTLHLTHIPCKQDCAELQFNGLNHFDALFNAAHRLRSVRPSAVKACIRGKVRHRCLVEDPMTAEDPMPVEDPALAATAAAWGNS